jgi:hypothetical protein
VGVARVVVAVGDDSDGDGLPDDYESRHGCLQRTIADNDGDPDADGLSSSEEFLLGSDPCSSDTDGDTLGDHVEVQGGSNLLLPDTDFDGVLDGAEPAGNFDGDGLPNVLDPDSDNDGLPDGVEVRICGTIACASPLGDADGDLITNLDEVSIFTDPLDADSDNDGLTDGTEVVAGTDPLVPDRTPPVPVLTQPVPGTQVVRGDSIVLAASATDDGRVTRVEFFVDGQRVGTDFTAPYSAAFAVPDSSQPLVFEIRATDTNANTGSTGSVSINVGPDPLTAVTGTVVDPAGVVVAGATAEVRLPDLVLESGETAIDGGAMTVDPGTHLGTSSLTGSLTFAAGDRGFLDTVVDLDPAEPLLLSGTLTLDFTGNDPGSPTPRSGTLALSGAGGSGLSMQMSGAVAGILPVTGTTSLDLELAVTAFAAGGVLTAQPLEDREVTVRLQGTLELVADPGTSNITAAAIDGDVVVIVHPALIATTGVDGRFSIQGVPSIHGSLIVDARFAEPGRPVLSGASAPAAPVRGGTTDVGTIALALAPPVASFPYPLFKVGLGSLGVASGDWNGDGNDDFAITSASAGQVWVLFGNGQGTFGPEVPDGRTGLRLTAGSDPGSLLATDVNNDGRLDLVVANLSGDNVQVFLGNGAGGFQLATTPAVGDRPEQVEFGDFDGDGRRDLVVANRLSNDLSLLFGNGDGTFRPQIRIPVAGGPRGVDVVDFNGDGRDDLAVAALTADEVAVLMGNGDGTFAPAARYAAGDGAALLVAADFNRDGRQDLAVANNLSDDVSVLLGNGDGSFASQVRYPALDSPQAIVAADFNGGGVIDLAVMSDQLGVISVFLGNPDGTFRPQARYDAGSFSRGLTVADFNRDGAKDLGFANANASGSVIFGRGDGTFASQRRVPVPPATNNQTNARSIAAGDLNGDGRQDFVVTVGDANRVSVFLGNGNATFQAPLHLGAGAFPATVEIADLNDDGRQDLVVGNRNSDDVSVYLGNGNGTFGAQARYPAGQGPHDVAVGDFNEDGRRDLAVADFGSTALVVLLGNGDGTFGPATRFAPGLDLFTSVEVGDFNEDGHQDLAVVKFFFHAVGIMLGAGDGSFAAPVFYASGNFATFAIWVDSGDFDGDGHRDLAVANLNSDEVAVFKGRGDGTFPFPTLHHAGDNPHHVVVGDLNGDGRDDIVVSNSEPIGADTEDVVLVMNRGDGTFPARGLRLTVGRSPFAAAIADFDGDGRPDLAAVNQISNDVSILLNEGP